ncbi:hypothetical protein QFC22_004829 [Naganishia vaughanmartiniae]|uniref:Uncharacterized protein n=1 Tax=Naganishia vaughanmartiniae TaxID=1424756 RepID=A0ACC2WY43_9TREE|nr:hypothetical protein QFC22_004829 [Naganishia vaughanmartiniae]
MANNKGPLGILPGMTFDPVRNRYFPTRQDEAPPRPAPSSNSLRAGFKERLKRGRGGGTAAAKTTSDQGSSDSKPRKEDRSTTKGKKPRTKAALGKEDITDSSSCLDRNIRRIDRTLLRATGLELARNDRFQSPTHAETQKRRQRERAFMYSRMTSITPHDEPAFPSALTVTTILPDQPSSILLGDSMGSIHAVKMEYDLPDWDFDMDVRQTGGKSMPRMRRWLWQEINLGKRITGICATNEHYIATTFGPRPRIVVSQIPAMLSAFEGTSSTQPSFFQEEEKPTVLWELTKVQDAWSMDSVGNAVIVGGNHQIVYAQDIVDPVFRSIRTPGDSDALSVCQINILALFDLRFAKTGPVQRYHEHVNDYRSGLGLAVDPTGTHVFAAGSDHKIRAWSILNGQPVPDVGRQSETQGQRRLLGDSYASLINGIEVTEDNRIHILNDRQLETYMQY